MSEPSKITEQLIDLLKSRDAFGQAKYEGKTLDRKDLTIEQWLQHQTEELLDGAGYAQAAIREIAALRAELVKRTAELKEGFRLAAEYAAEAGYATGQLKMSEAAGVVDGWMDRAKKAEAERDAALAQLATARAEVAALQCTISEIQSIASSARSKHSVRGHQCELRAAINSICDRTTIDAAKEAK